MIEKYYLTKVSKKKIPYLVEILGSDECGQGLNHKIKFEYYKDRIAIEFGIVYASFECAVCGRLITQTIGEILPPKEWEK